MSDAPEKKLTKKELRMLARQKAQEEKAEKAAAEAAASAHLFGDLPRIQSTTISGRVWTRVNTLAPPKVGDTVLIRARLHHVRQTGKNVFLVLRQNLFTVQAILFSTGATPKAMISYVASLTMESIVDVTGEVVAVESPVTSVSQQAVELRVKTLHCVSKAEPTLPFLLADVSRPVAAGEEEAAEKEASAGAGGDDSRGVVHVKQDLRLDYRWIDLRTPANQSIMRISSGVCALFREFLLDKGFVEIQTPKLVGGASEGGAEVFRLKYFGQDACMAQSPQLYKQMCAAGTDFERVFEIGPVFRAEDSNTARHLCEFHGMDFEMVFNEHYFEVLDVFSDLFSYIFDGLNARFRAEIETVRAQYPFEDMKYLSPALRLTYAEGCKLLTDAGFDQDPEKDLSTPAEKALGAIVKEKYGTDFFMMDKYPLAARPFYTMPDPANPALSNSYDMFIRGQEIVSGAQRIHDPELLTERAKAHGIPLDTIQPYVDAFKYGALPHAGGGIGLERVVMLFLGLNNIRKSAMFTRDPKRLAP